MIKSSTSDRRLTPEEESHLMARVTSGDPTAFSDLTDAFRPLIFSTVYKVINHTEDAEDLTQDVLISVWKKAQTWEASKGKLSTWIATISRNRAIDRIRSHQRQAALRDNLQKEALAGEAPQKSAPKGDRFSPEARDLVRKAVVSLTAEQRDAIELAYFKGLTQSQTAEKLGTPLGTTKARIRRGVQRLRGIVEDELGADFEIEAVAS